MLQLCSLNFVYFTRYKEKGSQPKRGKAGERFTSKGKTAWRKVIQEHPDQLNIFKKKNGRAGAWIIRTDKWDEYLSSLLQQYDVTRDSDGILDLAKKFNPVGSSLPSEAVTSEEAAAQQDAEMEEATVEVMGAEDVGGLGSITNHGTGGSSSEM